MPLCSNMSLDEVPILNFIRGEKNQKRMQFKVLYGRIEKKEKPMIKNDFISWNI